MSTTCADTCAGASLSSRRAWIEIARSSDDGEGACGSLSSRRAWIEIMIQGYKLRNIQSLSSRRAWIEMSWLIFWSSTLMGRSPHGERGLKYRSGRATRTAKTSLSSRRAWIEISSGRRIRGNMTGRSPHGERGLKSSGAWRD